MAGYKEHSCNETNWTLKIEVPPVRIQGVRPAGLTPNE